MPDDVSPPTPDDDSTYVDTPYGMVTASGEWYHIPEDAVRDYAGAVLDYVTLDQLLRWADAWKQSPRTLTLWVLPPLLWALPPGGAALAALGGFVGWALIGPALPSIVGARIASVLSNRWVQAAYYAAIMSLLATQGRYAAVGIGLTAFVLFRWGVVQWAARMPLQRAWRRLYPLPVTDQILRGLIVRVALKHRLALPQVDDITEDIMDNWGHRSDSDAAG